MADLRSQFVHRLAREQADLNAKVQGWIAEFPVGDPLRTDVEQIAQRTDGAARRLRKMAYQLEIAEVNARIAADTAARDKIAQDLAALP